MRGTKESKELIQNCRDFRYWNDQIWTTDKLSTMFQEMFEICTGKNGERRDGGREIKTVKAAKRPPTEMKNIIPENKKRQVLNFCSSKAE